MLATGETNLIGVIMPNSYMPYHSDVLQKALSYCNTNNYKLFVFSGDNEDEKEKEYIQQLLTYNIEGLLVLSHTLTSDYYASLNIPVVSIEREDNFISSVNTDNLMGGIQATSLLYRNKCDIYIFIDTVSRPGTPSIQRFEGFKEICRLQNLRHEVILKEMGTSTDEIYESLGCIVDSIELRYKDKRVGIFCANDTIAALVQKYYYQRYHISRDHYRLVGYDDSALAQNSIIPFSSVGQQTDLIAKHAIEMLTRQIKVRRETPGCSLPIEHEVITPILICRETSIPEV